MVNEQFFTKDIIEKAQQQADDIIFAAETAKIEAFAVLELELQKLAEEFVLKETNTTSQILKSSSVECRATASGEVLKAKQAAIDSVFAKAQQEILSLNDARYKEFITELIKKHATSGDTVVVAIGDKKRIDKVFLDAIANKLKIKLELSKDNTAASGGIILQNQNCDINLTIDALLSQTRHKLESVVARALWQ